MSGSAGTPPRVARALVTWAAANAGIAALVGARVAIFGGLPEETAYPALELRVVGAEPVDQDSPLRRALVDFHCWGSQTVAGVPDGHDSAEALCRAVDEAVHGFPYGQAMGTAEVGLGAEAVSFIWLPDPTTHRARYVLSASFVIRSSA